MVKSIGNKPVSKRKLKSFPAGAMLNERQAKGRTMAKSLPNHMEGYAMVEDRIPVFYAQFPDGRITTEVVGYTDDSVITRSFIYRNAEDQEKNIPLSTGICKEIFTPKMTKYVENCETSSIGRALANYNIRGVDEEGNQAKRPSLEEMQSVDALQDAQPKLTSQDSPNGGGHMVEEAVRLGGTVIQEPSPLTEDDYATSQQEHDFVQSVGNEPACPDHGPMVWKEGVGQKGPYAFWSCSQFPSCRVSADKDGKVRA